MNDKPVAGELSPVIGKLKKHSGLPFQIIRDPAQRASPWWLPVLSVILAFIFCGFFIAAGGTNPIIVYTKMFEGTFGSSYGVSETLVKAIPLLLCGLGVSLAYRISVWNIGAEGQFAAGAMAATAVTIYLPHLPGVFTIPVMVIAGILAGAVWGLFTAIPKAYFQVNELISSLMLNYVALLLMDYFVFGPWRDPNGLNFPGTPMFTASQQLLTLGGTRLHLGLIYGLAAVVLYAFFIHHTRWGYELRVLGANPSVARYAGIRIKRHILLVMLLSGGMAGLAGMSEVSGVTHRLMYGISPGYGYTAIIVAWIARLNPWGLLLSSFLFGGLIVGGYSIQTIGLPASTSLIIQGAILFFLIGGETLRHYRWVWRKE